MLFRSAEPRVTPRHDPSLVLRGEHCTARVRPWSFRPDTAHLVMVQQQSPPDAADLEQWSRRIARLGYARVRTNALGESMRDLSESAGFRTVQELVLLEHVQPGDVPIPSRASRRLAPSAHVAASVVDRQAFGTEWGLDDGAIDDVRTATPRHRARFIAAPGGTMAGYAITGRDVRQGFVQRLAVAPDQQRSGVGRSLVLDALRWLACWRVHRVLVNTAVDNHAALALYDSVGFTPLAERLRVLERDLT